MASFAKVEGQTDLGLRALVNGTRGRGFDWVEPLRLRERGLILFCGDLAFSGSGVGCPGVGECVAWCQSLSFDVLREVSCEVGWRGAWLKRGPRECFSNPSWCRELERYYGWLHGANDGRGKSASKKRASAVLPVPAPLVSATVAAESVSDCEQYSVEWTLERLRRIAETAEREADQIKAYGEIARIKQLSKHAERELESRGNSLQITIKGLGGRAGVAPGAAKVSAAVAKGGV